MITARNEFETVEAFTHLAGCSLGTWTQRETAAGLLEILDKVASHDVTADLWRELAKATDDSGDVLEIQGDAAERLNDHLPMPPDCVVTVDDGEYHVVPFVDYSLPSFDDIPDDNSDGDDILLVSDHGNVTRMSWDYSAGEWRTDWSMV